MKTEKQMHRHLRRQHSGKRAIDGYTLAKSVLAFGQMTVWDKGMAEAWIKMRDQARKIVEGVEG